MNNYRFIAFSTIFGAKKSYAPKMEIFRKPLGDFTEILDCGDQGERIWRADPEIFLCQAREMPGVKVVYKSDDSVI